MASGPFVRDVEHWLLRLSSDEWIQAALTELRQAERAFSLRDSVAGMTGLRRACGMALNGALVVSPRESWGRTYVQHLEGLSAQAQVPASVREAARLVLDAQPPASGLAALRSQAMDQRLLDAARTVMAHAYAVVYGSQGREVE